MEKIARILEDFSEKKIAVIGDIMLDSYVYGTVERVSPEAPVSIFKEEKEEYSLGGAANVAANISSLNGKVYLFGYIGEDSAGKILISKIEEKKINHFLFPVLEKTTKKTRLIGNRQQQMIRIDSESYAVISEDAEERLAKEVAGKNPDIIVVSDYAKGCITSGLFSKLKNYLPNTKIIVDPRPQNKEKYKGVFLITPNLKEAREMSGMEKVEDMGKILQERYKCSILITRGKEGMSLFENDKVNSIPTKAKEVYDITGAGDTVIAVMALSLASGVNLEESSFLANHAAGIVVGKAGTASVSKNELIEGIKSESSKIKDLSELKEIREDCRKKGKKVVWTNGCFDLLHIGHIDYLKKAKKLGNCFFVGLNSDVSIKQLKGEGRPIQSEKHRAEILASLELVDYIVIFNEMSAENCLSEIKPDIFVKAGDYNLETMHQGERFVIEGYRGEIQFIPIAYDISTTQIINKIGNNNA
jgi:D-beta-D-heptose 7-phosphate kinase / D-beta-D-heptose 1-phosphate adenosyltransferase